MITRFGYSAFNPSNDKLPGFAGQGQRIKETPERKFKSTYGEALMGGRESKTIEALRELIGISDQETQTKLIDYVLEIFSKPNFKLGFNNKQTFINLLTKLKDIGLDKGKEERNETIDATIDKISNK